MINRSTRKNAARKNATRKTSGPITISELKKALGYSPRTRYATMLKDRTNKLKNILDSSFSSERVVKETTEVGGVTYTAKTIGEEVLAAQLKKFMKTFAGAAPAERAKIRKEARESKAEAEKTRLEFDNFNAAMERRARAQEREMRRDEARLLSGDRSAKISYSGTEKGKLLSLLKRLKPALDAGEKLMIETVDHNDGGKKSWYALSLQKLADVLKTLEQAGIGDSEANVPIESPSGADAELTEEQEREYRAWQEELNRDMGVDDEPDDSLIQLEDLLRSGDVGVSVSHAPSRSGAAWSRKNGAFFPYTHDYDDADLTAELAKLGCHAKIEPENYEQNCLWHAFKSAGVGAVALEAMKLEFKQRKISRLSIKKVALAHKLRVVIHTDGDKQPTSYGPEDGHFVDLALISDPMSQHYVHIYRTKFCRYAVENYEQVKNTKNWWTWAYEGKRASKGEESRFLMSHNLLKLVRTLPRCKRIDISTTGILQTQFSDRVSKTEFATLEYEEGQSRLKHEPRLTTPVIFESQGEVKEGKVDRIKAMRSKLAMSDPSSLALLDKKFLKFGFGMEEQSEALRKAVTSLGPKVFFDFETCPHGKHECYAVCFSEEGEEEVHRLKGKGPELAKRFLDELLERYGKDGDGLKSEEVKKYRTAVQPQIQEFRKLKEEAGCVHCGICFDAEHPPQVDHCGDREFRHLVRDYSKRAKSKASPEDFAQYHAKHAELQLLCKDCHHSKPIAESVTLLAHNMSYDFAFIQPLLKRLSLVIKANKVVCGQGTYGGKILNSEGKETYRYLNLRFKDTLAMITTKLAKFGETFKLEQAKEIFPHTLMTHEFVAEGALATEELLRSGLDSEAKVKQVVENCKNIGAVTDDGRFDLIEYSLYYCARDVQVLKQGWGIFNRLMRETFLMDCYCFPTMAGLADQYFIDHGCFDGVHEIAGVPQAFIAQCSVGGRVMCANNQSYHVKEKLADFDGVSQYPSAMYALGGGTLQEQIRLAAEEDARGCEEQEVEEEVYGGYLMGAPEVYDPAIHDLAQVDAWFAKVRITHIAKEYKFPTARVRTPAGAHWTNDLVGKEIFIDSHEDLTRFQGAKYEILQGYVFTKGRNPAIKNTILHLFNERRRIKKIDPKNPLQMILKLMMNAAYGRCGLKAINVDVKYIEAENLPNFISNHFNFIRIGTDLGNGTHRIELYKEIQSHYNRQHVACEILSVSKRPMNEVMCLAEDLNVLNFYSDTDSMHIEYDKVETLGEAYCEKYGRELIGDMMGQFHVDFEDIKKGVKGVHAVESYFLAKKIYADRLKDDKDNEGIHYRMKGIPPKAVEEKAKEKKYGGDILKIYKDLFEGEPVTFIIQCSFKTGKDHSITTVQMKRTIHFPHLKKK